MSFKNIGLWIARLRKIQGVKTTPPQKLTRGGQPVVNSSARKWPSSMLHHYERGFHTDDFMDLRLDAQLSKIRDTDVDNDDIRIYPQDKHFAGVRKTMGRNLPIYVKGAVALKPDANDIASMIDGVKHRVGGTTPPINRQTLFEFKQFVRYWIRDNLTPLDAETDVSVEGWLKDAPYTIERKAELLDIYNRYVDGYLHGRDVDFERLESFIKDEFYTCPKTFRTINSRVEIFKCLVGPTIAQVEKSVFSLPYFIKKIPVDNRAEYILNFLDSNARIFGTDVSAWEGSMSREIMEACEVQLFDYMTKNLPSHDSFMKLYRQLLLNNKLCFSGFVVEILSRRMSGEMSTSVANGFTNLMLMLFTAHKMGVPIKLVVEGDDTLISCIIKLTNQYARELGFNLIIEEFDHIREASFCGLIFSDIKHTIRDPIPALLKFGWATQQYVGANYKTCMQLLRAKALSLKCEMPNCPILGVLADRVIELTSGICVKKSIQRLAKYMSLYHRNEFLELIADYKRKWTVPANISPDSRVLMEKMFNIPVDAQLTIEKQLSEMELGPIESEILGTFIPRDNKIFWEMYIKDTPYALYEDVVVHTERVNRYMTHLPGNSAVDPRNVTPSYAIGVAA